MAVVAVLLGSIFGLCGALYGLIIGDMSLLAAFSFYLIASLGCGMLCAISFVQKLRTRRADAPQQAIKV